jgi:vacuolar protein sorting-associated protein VTA1
MSAVIPAEYKALTPYIKRAEELANDTVNTPESKYVSYYCLLYAIERGMKIVASDQTFLYALFEKAEHNKILFGIDKIESNKEVICENFAFTVFSNADNEDRSGAATMATAKSFYAASIFLDILEQFNPSMEEEVLEKRKYAKWRSSEIIKALKEGRAPSAPTAKVN